MVLNLDIEFSGGLELLFNKETHLKLKFEKDAPKNLLDLIIYLLKEKLNGKQELFVSDDLQSVRPGILVLVNDTDWELCDGTEYELQNNDSIVFISTLHGG